MILISNVFTSIPVILSSPELLFDLIMSAICGTSAFIVAVKLCGVRELPVKMLKYIMAMFSVVFITNFFVVLISGVSYHQGLVSMGLIPVVLTWLCIWVGIYEIGETLLAKISRTGRNSLQYNRSQK